MKSFFVFLCLFAFAAGLFAAPVNEDSWTLAVKDGTLALSLALPDGAHAYEASTGPVLPDGVAAVAAPEAKQEVDALTGELDSFFVCRMTAFCFSITSERETDYEDRTADCH